MTRQLEGRDGARDVNHHQQQQQRSHRPRSEASRRRAQLRGRWPPHRADGPDPELAERPKRRTFTADYKLKILAEVDAATEPGEIGALLPREE
jgi:hypothetical protein